MCPRGEGLCQVGTGRGPVGGGPTWGSLASRLCVAAPPARAPGTERRGAASKSHSALRAWEPRAWPAEPALWQGRWGRGRVRETWTVGLLPGVLSPKPTHAGKNSFSLFYLRGQSQHSHFPLRSKLPGPPWQPGWDVGSQSPGWLWSMGPPCPLGSELHPLIQLST